MITKEGSNGSPHNSRSKVQGSKFNVMRWEFFGLAVTGGWMMQYKVIVHTGTARARII
jgi:hypothetical protein